MPAIKKHDLPKLNRSSRSRSRNTQPSGMNASGVLTKAALVSISIGIWEGRKHDREVTAKVNSQHHADPHAGRYNKHLLGGSTPTLGAILTAVTQLRETHHEQTVPWTDTGWRLLPMANYMEYTAAMRDKITKFDAAVEAFLDAYPKLARQAEEKLQGMYRRADYPSVDSLRHRFHRKVQFSPLPAAEDFRISLPEEELRQMQQDVTDRLTRATTEALQDCWQRLGDAVSNVRGRLDDGKHLRESMITRLSEVAASLGRLNLTGDAALDTACNRVLTSLGTLDVATVKSDEKARATAARDADAILKAMAGMYTPATTK